MSWGSFFSGALHAGTAVLGSLAPVTTAVQEFKQGNIGRGLVSVLAPGIGSAIIASTSTIPSVADTVLESDSFNEKIDEVMEEYGDMLSNVGHSVVESVAERYGFSEVLEGLEGLPDDEVQPNVPQDYSASLLPSLGVFGSLALLARFLI